MVLAAITWGLYGSLACDRQWSHEAGRGQSKQEGPGARAATAHRGRGPPRAGAHVRVVPAAGGLGGARALGPGVSGPGAPRAGAAGALGLPALRDRLRRVPGGAGADRALPGLQGLRADRRRGAVLHAAVARDLAAGAGGPGHG